MATVTITEFLLARISEDEASARDIAASDQRAGRAPEDFAKYVIDPTIGPYGGQSRLRNVASGLHLARFGDPTRVLAECKAKRAIIEFHKQWPVLVEGGDGLERVLQREGNDLDSMTYTVTRQMAWLTQDSYIKTFGTQPPTTPMIRALAAVYADHPDYQQEWAER